MDDLDLAQTIRGFSPGHIAFKRYTLKRILGRGGMGVVWLAHDDSLGRDIALKFLPEVIAHDKEAVEDLKRETRKALELTHPRIVRIYDFLEDGRTAAVSMEYVNGSTLAVLKHDQPGGCFGAEALRPWVVQLCDALVYAHEEARIVHRDLKPVNLMTNSKGALKVTDFGISATMTDTATRASRVMGTSGTPVYMSPQQMMGDKPAATDDIYAFGATLYELLTGRPPFYTGNILLQVQNKIPPAMARRREELEVKGAGPIPESWEKAIARCLAKETSARPQSMRELIAVFSSDQALPEAAAVPASVPAARSQIPATAPASLRPPAPVPPVAAAPATQAPKAPAKPAPAPASAQPVAPASTVAPARTQSFLKSMFQKLEHKPAPVAKQPASPVALVTQSKTEPKPEAKAKPASAPQPALKPKIDPKPVVAAALKPAPVPAPAPVVQDPQPVASPVLDVTPAVIEEVIPVSIPEPEREPAAEPLVAPADERQPLVEAAAPEVDTQSTTAPELELVQVPEEHQALTPEAALSPQATEEPVSELAAEPASELAPEPVAESVPEPIVLAEEALVSEPVSSSVADEEKASDLVQEPELPSEAHTVEATAETESVESAAETPATVAVAAEPVKKSSSLYMPGHEPHRGKAKPLPKSVWVGVGVAALVLLLGLWYWKVEVPRQLESDAVEARQKAVAEEARKVLEEQKQRETQLAEEAAARGAASVMTDPLGATVWFDDESKGAAPVFLKDLKLGKHTVRVSMDGYETWSGEVQVTGKGVAELTCSLTRTEGELVLKSEPEDLRVTVFAGTPGLDGTGKALKVLRTPASLNLPVGTYTLVFSKPGWAEQQQQVSIKLKQRTEASALFLPGTVAITSRPTGAKIMKDGLLVGRTPDTLSEVLPGHWTAELVLDGYQPTPVSGDVQAGKQLTLDVSLKKLYGAPVPTEAATPTVPVEAPARDAVVAPVFTPPAVVAPSSSVQDNDEYLGTYDIKNVDVKPVPVERMAPQFPLSMRKAGLSGEVLISFIIDRDGSPVSVVAVRSTRKEFEQPAINAVSQWRFKPARKNGKPVGVRMMIPMVFNLTE